FLSELDELPDVPGFDHYFLVEPGELASLYVVPAVNDEQIMGRYEYLYEIVNTIDAEPVPEYGYIDPEFETYLENIDELNNGQLTFTTPDDAPGGEYRVTFAPIHYQEEVLTT